MAKLKSWQKEMLQVAAVIIAALIFYQGMAFALQTPLPILSVVSNSMEPTLHVGDLIIAGKADYKEGDIAIYISDRVTIVHRIVEKRPDGYVFKGDNNAVPDPRPVPRERITGKVHVALPLLGYPRLLLHWIGV